MASSKVFNDFMSFQTEIFKDVFQDVEKISPPPKPIVFKKPQATNLSIMQTPRPVRTKEENTKQIIEKSIQEVKESRSKNPSTSMKVKLPRKDVKRLGSEVNKSIGRKKSDETGSSKPAAATMKAGKKVKILSEPIVFAPQFEIID